MTTGTYDIGYGVVMTCDEKQCEFVFEGSRYSKNILGRSAEEMIDYAKKTIAIRLAQRIYQENSERTDGTYLLTAPRFAPTLRTQYPDKQIVITPYLGPAYLDGKGWCFTDEEPLELK